MEQCEERERCGGKLRHTQKKHETSSPPPPPKKKEHKQREGKREVKGGLFNAPLELQTPKTINLRL